MTDGANPEVVIDGVTKRYGRTLALDEVSLAVRPNEQFALLGPNGAGKTTLLHILCTILKPDSGTARIGGIDVVAQPLAARRSLGVVFQEPSLDDRLTVYENLNFHGLVYGVPAGRRKSRIDEMLHLVDVRNRQEAVVDRSYARLEPPRRGPRRRYDLHGAENQIPTAPGQPGVAAPHGGDLHRRVTFACRAE